MPRHVVTFVLAGGRGSRLFPLTQERAKPAVPFGGKYRIIDFVLSNLINSGIYSIYVLVQFKSQALLRHLRDGWQFGGLLKDQFIVPVPAQMRSADETWYTGTADAIFQNLNLIEDHDEHLVGIFGADHIYRMNVRDMVDFHERMHADVTVAAIPVSAHLAAEFGVVEAAADGAILGFHEKTAQAPTIPGEPHSVYASMGNYVFSARTLLRELEADSRNRIAGTTLGATFYLPCLDELLCTRTIIRRTLFPESRRMFLLIGETWELLKRITRRTWIFAGSYLPSIFTTGAGLYERPAILTQVRSSVLMKRVVRLKP